MFPPTFPFPVGPLSVPTPGVDPLTEYFVGPGWRLSSLRPGYEALIAYYSRGAGSQDSQRHQPQAHLDLATGRGSP